MPLGRTSTRPRPSSAAASRSIASRAAAVAAASAPRSAMRTLTSFCGSFSIAVAVGEVGAAERLEREQRRGDAVAGGHEAHVDDVAGLLAAERPAALAQRLEHVAVADRRGRDLDPRVAHRGVEAVVGHHRHGDAVAGQAVGLAQVQRGERDQLVAVDDGAGAVDRQHAVAVAVEREADVVAALASSCPRARSTWVEPQPSLMLRPSGAAASTSTSAPRRRKISGAAR